jgi:hypothetical protein
MSAILVRPDRKDERRRFGNLGGMRQWVESRLGTRAVVGWPSVVVTGRLLGVVECGTRASSMTTMAPASRSLVIAGNCAPALVGFVVRGREHWSRAAAAGGHRQPSHPVGRPREPARLATQHDALFGDHEPANTLVGVGHWHIPAAPSRLT